MNQYLTRLWQTILNTLQFDQRVFQMVEDGSLGLAILIGVAFIGGVSLLLGQSVILFANRVRPTRFIASLLLNGILYIGSLVVWAGSMRLVGWSVAGEWIPRGDIVNIMLLTAAPMVFGVLILIPYLGPFINRFLNIWSFLIAYQIIIFKYQTAWWQALIVVGTGWLLSVLISNTIGWPIIAASRYIRNWVAGADLNQSTNELIERYGQILLADSQESSELGMAHGEEDKVNTPYDGMVMQ
ncbi:MAG: hypothetical protein AAF702_15555 [Chloroflexota bacterium]